MTIKTFIERAIEGGWNEGYTIKHHGEFGDVLLVSDMRSKALVESEILLDPLAWQAVERTLAPTASSATIARAAEQRMVELVRDLNSGLAIEQSLQKQYAD